MRNSVFGIFGKFLNFAGLDSSLFRVRTKSEIVPQKASGGRRLGLYTAFSN